MTRLVVTGGTLLGRDADGDAGPDLPRCPGRWVLTEQVGTDRPGGAGLAALLAARDGDDA